MRIYVFKSDSQRAIRAFTHDPDPSKLPTHLGPWLATGTIPPGQSLPHGFARSRVEQSIKDLGFQMWRLKSK